MTWTKFEKIAIPCVGVFTVFMLWAITQDLQKIEDHKEYVMDQLQNNMTKRTSYSCDKLDQLIDMTWIHWNEAHEEFKKIQEEQGCEID